MKCVRPLLIACSVFIALVSATKVRCLPPQNTTWSETDWKWLSENFRVALDDALPLEKGSYILISYRSYETLQVGESEYSLTISEKRDDGKKGLSAHVRLPDGHAIGEQLLVFHRDHPLSSINEAEKNLNFKDWSLTDHQCPSLGAAMQKLKRVRIGLPTDKIVLDPTVHEFNLSSAGGDIHAVLVDTGNPLVVWGLETRRAIQACGAGNPTTKKSDGTLRE